MEMQQMALLPIPLKELTDNIVSNVLSAIKSEQVYQEEKLISPEQARKLFVPSISKVTLHAWTKAGHIPVHRVGGRIYYKSSEIIESAKRITKYDRDKQMA